MNSVAHSDPLQIHPGDPNVWTPGRFKVLGPVPLKGAASFVTECSDARTVETEKFVISAGDGAFTITAGDKTVTITEGDKIVTVDHKRFGSTILKGRELQITNNDIAVTIDTGGKDVLDLGAKRVDSLVKENGRNKIFSRSSRKKKKTSKPVTITAGYKNIAICIDDVSATISSGEKAVAIVPGSGAVILTAEGRNRQRIPGVEALTIIPRGGVVTVDPLGDAIVITLGEREITIIHEGGNTTTATRPNTSILGGRIITVVSKPEKVAVSQSITRVASNYALSEETASQQPLRSFQNMFGKIRKSNGSDIDQESIDIFFNGFFVEITSLAKGVNSEIYELLRAEPQEDKEDTAAVGESWIKELSSIQTQVELQCATYNNDANETVSQLQRMRDGEKLLIKSRILFEHSTIMVEFRNLIGDLIAFRAKLVEKRDGVVQQDSPIEDESNRNLLSVKLFDVCNRWITSTIEVLEDHEKKISGRVELLSAEYFRLVDNMEME